MEVQFLHVGLIRFPFSHFISLFDCSSFGSFLLWSVSLLLNFSFCVFQEFVCYCYFNFCWEIVIIFFILFIAVNTLFTSFFIVVDTPVKKILSILFLRHLIVQL